jgi:hypothetical protein
MSLGFHPWEKREGWWLTQIVGQSLPGNGWGGGGLYLKHTLKGDFFVNVTRVWDWPGANVGDPVDGALDFLNPADNYTAHTAQAWEKAGRPKASPDVSPNASRRTDQDIAANGFDYRCCEEEVKSKFKFGHCNSYNVLHQGCSTSGATPLRNNSYMDISNDGDHNSAPLCPGGKKVSGASQRLVPGVTVVLLALAFVAVLG